MKNALKVIGVIAFITAIGFITTCGDGGHEHQWGDWIQTTAPTYTTEGTEKRTCTLDPSHTETRSIPKIPIIFTAVTQSVFESSDYIAAIAYGNGKFVAGGSKGKMAVSTDGTTWTAVTQSVFGSAQIMAIAYGNGKFVAVGWGKMAYWEDE